MKLDKTRIIALIVLGIITFGVLGFFIYDSVTGEGFNSTGIVRICIVLFASLGSLVKILKGAKRDALSPELIINYRDSYSHIIRDGFNDDSKKSRDFFTALLYINKDEYAHAKEILEKIDLYSCRQNERFAVGFFIAFCYAEMGACNKAIEAYEELLDIEEHYTVLSNLGIQYHRSGRSKRAIEYFERATRANPTSAFAYNNLANCLLELAEYESLIEPALKAIELDSTMVSSYSALAIAYAMTGNEQESEKALQRACVLGRKRTDILETIEMLKAKG